MLKAIDIVEAAEDKVFEWIRRDSEYIQVSDTTYIFLSAHLDFDYQQFMLYTVCDQERNEDGNELQTWVSYLYVNYGPYGKVKTEWYDPKPLKFFDAWKEVGIDPYVKLCGWAEELLDTQP